MKDHNPSILSSSSLTGNDVENRQGESLGDIKDLMLDPRSGRVAYAVLDFGGFLGIGNKLFAVPLESMTLDTAAHRFVLDVDKERLENAPGFDKDNWPAHPDYNFINEVRSYYGLDAYHAEAATL